MRPFGGCFVLIVLSLDCLFGGISGCHRQNIEEVGAPHLTPETVPRRPGQGPKSAVIARPSSPGQRAVEAPAPPPELPPVEQGVSGLLQRVPTLRHRTAMHLEGRWVAIKAMSNLSRRETLLRRYSLLQKVCDDIIDFRALSPEQRTGFRYRDNVRGRSWVRPALAWVLIQALAKLRQEFPEVELSLGDLAQPGCGQLSHGVLVRTVTDGPDANSLHPGPATRLINRTRLVRGVPTFVALKRAFEFPQELSRFMTPQDVIRVEHRVVGRETDGDGRLSLRVATRRYWEPLIPDQRLTRTMKNIAAHLVRGGERVASDRVISVDENGKAISEWVTQFAHREKGRQLVIVSSSKVGRRLAFSAVREIRLSDWTEKKPGSFPDEIRWIRQDSETTPWRRWSMVYEAGHITHLSGRDLDISYVTKENKRHFAVDLDAVDAQKTFRWFELMSEFAQAGGLKVDRIIVNPKIKRLLMRALTRAQRRSKVWYLLRTTAGHDAHHHVRFEAPSIAADAEARVRLSLKDPRHSAVRTP